MDSLWVFKGLAAILLRSLNSHSIPVRKIDVSLEETYRVYAFTGGKSQAELRSDTRHFMWEWIIITSASAREAVIGICILLSTREFNCKQESIVN